MSADQLQTTTSDTVLRLKKTGETQLSRVLKLQANGLPPEGIDLDIDLSGTWEQNGDKLIQTADTVIILPRTATPLASKWADQLQKQAEGAAPSIKIILAADKQQLILQDTVSGATDIYIRK